MADTRNLPAFAWNGNCVYGGEKSIKAVQALVEATQAAQEVIHGIIEMDGPDPAGILLQTLNKLDRALSAGNVTSQRRGEP